MSEKNALYGTFVKLVTLMDGGIRITLDLQCTLAEVAALGLTPGIAFGLARINGSSTVAQAEEKPDEPKTKAGPICVMACNFCNDKRFWSWIFAEKNTHIESSLEAKQFILTYCNIKSRKDLDEDKYAEKIFLNEIRLPYLAWKQ